MTWIPIIYVFIVLYLCISAHTASRQAPTEYEVPDTSIKSKFGHHRTYYSNWYFRKKGKKCTVFVLQPFEIRKFQMKQPVQCLGSYKIFYFSNINLFWFLPIMYYWKCSASASKHIRCWVLTDTFTKIQGAAQKSLHLLHAI